MAIKVRHDGNNAAVIAAGAGSGRAKRRVETAKLAQNTPQHIQTLGAAHASAPGVGGGSAPLTHAPNGASGASAPITHAPAPTAGMGGAGSRSSFLRGSGAAGDLGEVKVTGNSFFTRPDKESQWNPATMRWERPWLPGEKEAEAAQRMNPVLAERAETQQALADQSMERKMRLQGKLAEQTAQRDRELYDYKLTRKQRMELSAINDALEEARASGRFTPDQLAELERQAYISRAGIKPLPTPREKDAQKAFNERIVTAGGVQGYINSKGDFEPFQDPNAKSKRRLTLNDVLKNVPMRELDPTDKTGLKEIDIPIDRRLDTAQKILDRMYPPNATVPGNAPAAPAADPLDMLFPWSRAMLTTGPFAPPSPAPAPPSPAPEKPFTGVAKTPDDAKKKWGVRR